MSGIFENAVRDKAALREMVEEGWSTLKVRQEVHDAASVSSIEQLTVE